MRDEEQPTSQLLKADVQHVDVIVKFLEEMANELQEFTLDRDICKQSIINALKENTAWFLFLDEQDKPFGTCYVQSVHNYWRLEKRFYLGGFYIAPSHRKQGRFKVLNQKLKEWAIEQGGVQIYAHIHKANQTSLRTFQSVGMDEIDYVLCANHWGDDG